MKTLVYKLSRAWHGLRTRYKLLAWSGLVVLVGLLTVVTQGVAVPVSDLPSQATPKTSLDSRTTPAQPSVSLSNRQLPPLQTHPLPPLLAKWQDPSHSGDYFDQIQPTEVGFLVWSEFPITVYVQPPSTATNPSSLESAWVKAVQAAIQGWMPYLPLQPVDQAEQADITIWRSQPPLRLGVRDRPSNSLGLERVRSAETRYELFVEQVEQAEQQPARLIHRCTITLNPQQTAAYIQAAIRHELGHALGIWGHSPQPTDALYFSQVRNPALISSRDVNTLKRIYEQPTRLGWSLKE